MRIIPQSRWRKHLFFVGLIALVIGGGWTVLVLSQSPITLVNSRKLKGTAIRADAERLFGPTTSPVRIMQPKPYKNLWVGLGGADYPDFWWSGLDLPGFPTGNWNGEPVILAKKIGDLTPGWSQSLSSSFHRPLWAEVCTWDGPEAQITAGFDDKGRMYGCRVQGRLNWRGNVREWLPWLP